MKKIVLPLLALLICAAPAGAQKEPLFAQDESDRKAPLKVTSERMVSSKKNNLISFFGSVIAIKGKLKVEADVIHVTTGKEQGEYEEMEATGSVKITNNGKVATGDKANYYPDERKIILTGNTTLTSENDKAFGDKVIYYLDSEDMEIFGNAGSPSVAIFYPGGSKPAVKPAVKPAAKKKTKPESKDIKVLEAKAPVKEKKSKPKVSKPGVTAPKLNKDETEEVKDELAPKKGSEPSIQVIEKKSVATANLKKTFTVQVGSYSQKDEALKLGWTLKGKGHDVYIKMFEKDGAKWYRVRIGEYKTRNVAERVAKKLKEQEDLPAFLTPFQN